MWWIYKFLHIKKIEPKITFQQITVLVDEIEDNILNDSDALTKELRLAKKRYNEENALLTKEEFLLNSEILCVDVSISALSSLIGQVTIPILGAVIGNTIGSFVFEIAKDNLTKKSRSW